MWSEACSRGLTKLLEMGNGKEVKIVSAYALDSLKAKVTLVMARRTENRYEILTTVRFRLSCVELHPNEIH
jgi:spore maturation protein SpmB